MNHHPKLLTANSPLDDQGYTYHVGVKAGEVANRIITVGDPARAIMIATKLDGGSEIDPLNHHAFLNYKSSQIMIKTSNRLFTTVTGTYKGVPVSIVAIGMGLSMMDFFVREVSAVVSGPFLVIRFGSCGSLGKARTGDIVVATESIACLRNYDYFHVDDIVDPTNDQFTKLMDQRQGPYNLTTPIYADKALSDSLTQCLQLHVPATHNVVNGLDITADSFFSSQARIDPSFNDANQHLIPYLVHKYPTAECFQMETFVLFHLAHSARPHPASGAKLIRVAACAMVFANRGSDSWIDPTLIDGLQESCSIAILEALIHVPIEK